MRADLVSTNAVSRGVRKTRSGRYEARAQKGGKHIYLGTYDTRKEAEAKRQEWEATQWQQR